MLGPDAARRIGAMVNHYSVSSSNALMIDPLSRGQQTALTGYDAFSLNYRLRWPMNLIVSDIGVLKYQLIS